MKRHTKYTEEEIQIIKNLYPNVSSASVAKILGRGIKALNQKAAKLGIIKHKHYSEKENQIIKKQFPTETTASIAKQLNRNTSAVGNQAAKLGLKKERYYSEKENQIIKKLYPTESAASIAKRLNRGVKAINRQASILGVKKANAWSKEDVQWLKDNYQKVSEEELVNKLNRPYRHIVDKANKSELTRNRWTPEEIKICKKYYNSHGGAYISELIGKSKETIVAIATKTLGLSSSCWWTEEEEKFLKENYKKIPIQDLMKNLDRSKLSIHQKATGMRLVNKKKESNLEIEIEKYLNINNFNFGKQFKIKDYKYRVDFIINNEILLEANGVFWHADPRIYTDYESLHHIQKKNVERDKKKYKILKDLGYKLIIIWENDFYENNDIVSQAISAVLNGDIEDYDSANTVKPEKAIPC